MQISVSQMTQISQISDLRKGKNIRLVTTHPCQDKESPPQPLKIKLGKLIRSETLLYCREGQHTWPPHHQKMCSPHFKYKCFVKPIFWAIIRQNRCFSNVLCACFSPCSKLFLQEKRGVKLKALNQKIIYQSNFLLSII